MSRVKITNSKGETIKAGCLVLNDNGQVLLVTDKSRTIWAFPKGHAEVGETEEQVAMRETLEETGYKVSLIKRLPDLSYKHGETGEPIRVALFLAKPIELSGQPEEENEWLTIDAARKVLYPNLVTYLDFIK